ncbi:DUF2917 domain-containing protein [Ramlibacter sp.]|uniref:DUF2917 domain-containing protein n=1 Tax=Ramlibacter sp. TaxID=1917967 RepID=UPI002BB6CE45|nr:DUF2917 domain-containing protein [Ramlibacter sp.]HWI81897.1 DUF2917 domain-containing protein [Ramlibacter sp.]
MVAITHHPYAVSLAARALYEIADAADVRIACEQGSVWITLDHDPRDIVLETGGAFRGADHRRALIYALAPCRLAVSPARAERPRPWARAPEPVLP